MPRREVGHAGGYGRRGPRPRPHSPRCSNTWAAPRRGGGPGSPSSGSRRLWCRTRTRRPRRGAWRRRRLREAQLAAGEPTVDDRPSAARSSSGPRSGRARDDPCPAPNPASGRCDGGTSHTAWPSRSRSGREARRGCLGRPPAAPGGSRERNAAAALYSFAFARWRQVARDYDGGRLNVVGQPQEGIRDRRPVRLAEVDVREVEDGHPRQRPSSSFWRLRPSSAGRELPFFGPVASFRIAAAHGHAHDDQGPGRSAGRR